MADALISIFKDQAESIIKEEFKLIFGVNVELQKMTTTFTAIQATLKDAEERQVEEEGSVKVWLQELKDISYSIDDVLDEWNTRTLRLQIEADDNTALVRKVCTSFRCFCLDEDVLRDALLFLSRFGFNHLILRHKISRSIKDIRNKLDVIALEKHKYKFKTTESRKEPERIITSSVVDTSKVYGREKDKKLIIDKLFGESSHQIKNKELAIISIVGMGGRGKTTLAQIVMDDDTVKAHFEKIIWVCVSDPFDKIRIAEEIIRAMGGSVPDVPSWDILHQCLRKSVEGKLFLLVLDDMWTEDDKKWEPFRLSLSFSAPGSRAIVTTRNTRIAIMMRSAYTHNLDKLSEDDTWSLLGGIALSRRSEEECKELEGVGKEIALKCKGLPLAAKTLGSLLLFKITKEDWLNVLESETWNLDRMKKDVLPALLLSYYDLPSHLKCCLEYCAIFPKDQKIWKKDLIELWMAQGFLPSTGDGEMERVGGEYFDDLVMRSFLHATYFDEDGKIWQCNMHDLVHDFVQFLTTGECLIIEKDAESGVVGLGCSAKTRHLTLLPETTQDTISSIFKLAVNLRTLRFPDNYEFSSGGLFPVSIFNLTCLRSLDLSWCRIEELPSEIEQLIHLRYLNLCGTKIKELPEGVSKLHNLQTLYVSLCWELVKLPRRFEHLSKMRHLLNYGTDLLMHLPKGIGKLGSLRTLGKFIVSGNDDGCKIHELKNLNHLAGKLKITGLGNITDLDEAREANLKNKNKLQDLSLEFDGDAAVGSEEIGKCKSMLEGLQLPPNLKALTIGEYPGTKFPMHLMMMDDRSAISTNLHCLCIFNCINCVSVSLPTLPSLVELSIGGLKEVRYMGRKFFEIRDDDDDDDVTKMRDTYDDDNDDDINIMPKLGDLFIRDCIELRVLPRHLSHTRLRVLCMKNCPSLSWTSSCIELPLLEDLHLREDVGDLGRSLAPIHIHLPILNSLTIQNSPHSLLPEGLCSLTTLQHLKVKSCNRIDNLSEQLQQLNMIQKLEVKSSWLLSTEQKQKVKEDLNRISHIPKSI